MPRAHFAIICCLVAASAGAADLQFFESKIRPVLVEHCYKCHSAQSEKLRGRLRVDSIAALLKGGESGPAVVPGDPEKSLLIKAVRYHDEDMAMPPKGKLAQAVVNDLAAWVKMGAPWPEEKPAVEIAEKSLDYARLKREHWSFRPLTDSAPPKAGDPIDAFITAKLDAAGLELAAPAERATLIRRVYIDLTGLLPTPKQIDAFVKDDSPDVLGKVIDQLLASPHFGERWGRHWLDVARFAESSGGSRAVMFNSAWRYRDYVIESFNADKPFNRFVIEQIAGDLLPYISDKQRSDQVIATGFLALGPKNLDTQDKDLLRMDVVDEQIDTVGRAFLGLSLGCARCHDHKFDPVTTAEYYALAGILRSTKTLLPGNVSGFVQRALPTDDPHAKAREDHAAALAELDAQIRLAKLNAPARREDAPAATAKVPVGALDPRKLPGIVIDDSEATVAGQWTPSVFSGSFVAAGYLHDQNKDKGAKSVTYAPRIEKAGEYEVRFAYTPSNNRSKATPITIRHAGDEEKTLVKIDQSKAPAILGHFVSLGRYKFDEGQQGWVKIETTGTSGHVIADAVWFIPVEEIGKEKIATTQAAAAPVATAVESDQVKVLQDKLAALKKAAPPDGPMAVAVQDEPDAADHHICIRGNNHNLGEKVPRGFLSIHPAPALKIAAKQSGRHELALWLADPKNPLVARVYVNRVWQHLFAVGLVRSTDDFGVTGEAPSNRELLDHLAMGFINDGWSTKKLIRRIMLTRAYQMSSHAGNLAKEKDPENRLLSHQNRKRLEGEVIRDAMLSLSGQLDLTMGGFTMKPGAVEFGYKYDGLRRSVYVPVLRYALLDVLEAFDFADPNLAMGRRANSTLATQSLLLMNSPFVMEQGKAFAARMLAMRDLDDPARLDLAYRMALSRPPTPAERELAHRFITDSARAREQSWSLLCQAIFACVDFRYAE